MAISKIPGAGVSADTLEAGDIAANAIGASELADNAVDTDAIADDAVTNAKIGADAVSTTEIANDASISTSGNIATTGSGTLAVAGTSTLTGNATASGNLTVTGDIVPSTSLSHRNMIINGAMTVAQRGTNQTSCSTTGFYSCDRMRLTLSSDWRVTQSQIADGPGGFGYSWKVDITTADASPGANDYLTLRYMMEGQDLQHLKKGTAGALPVTISFWVKAYQAGNYQFNLIDLDAGNRMIGGTYTINASATWEYKTLTIAGDTTGQLGNDNGASFLLEWWLDSGSSYQGGAVPTSWETQSDPDRMAATSHVRVGNHTDNYWQITGIQLEVGSNATPFEHRSFGEELLRCERYFQIGAQCTGRAYGTANAELYYSYRTRMRANPSGSKRGAGTSVNDDTGRAHEAGVASYDINTLSINAVTTTGCCINVAQTGTSWSAGDIIGIQGNPLNLDAEL